MLGKHVSTGWWTRPFILVAYESDREFRHAVRRYIHVCRVHVIGSSSEYRTRFILHTHTRGREHARTHVHQDARRAHTSILRRRLPGTLLGWKNASRFERHISTFRRARTRCCHNVQIYERLVKITYNRALLRYIKLRIFFVVIRLTIVRSIYSELSP